MSGVDEGSHEKSNAASSNNPGSVSLEFLPTGGQFSPSQMSGTIGGDLSGTGAQSDAAQSDTQMPGFDAFTSTLDEPVGKTILRDVKAVGKKFRHVFIPQKSKVLLRDWDLWGPLILCILFAVFIHDPSKHKEDGISGPEFVEVFVIFWLGSVIVTLNSKLIGGTLSFFQSICVLGYCSLPLTLDVIISKLIIWSVGVGTWTTALRIIFTLLAFGWATFASTAFLASSHPVDRRALGVYPIFLFYFVLAYIVIAHSSSHYPH